MRKGGDIKESKKYINRFKLKVTRDRGDRSIKMLKVKKVSNIIGSKVFTDGGDYFGEIEEANIVDNKIDGWRIRLARGSSIIDSLKGAKGIIVPHQFIKAIGEVIIVNKSVVPERETEEVKTEEINL